MTNEEKSEKPINPMTNQIVVITDSTGTKAWTVNPYGEVQPYPDSNGTYPPDENWKHKNNQWQQAESERKCYEVDKVINCDKPYHECDISCPDDEFFKPNTTYLAEIVDENTVRILKEI